MADRFNLTARQYTIIAGVTLAALTLIVFTGAAVRLTGSGLGCPTWPKCTSDQIYTPLHLHGLIEFGNRAFGVIVTLTSLAAVIGARLRRPYRPDLFRLSLWLPVGVVAQAVLGGLTVLYDLSPEWVAPHFSLSMVVLIPAVLLFRRSRREPGDTGEPVADRFTRRAVRALLPVGFIAIVGGTAATAAGPHAGGEGTGDVVARIQWFGADTLDRLVHYHGALATVFGLAAVGAWWLARTRHAGDELREPLTLTCILLAAQGVVGSAQFAMELPAEMVWLHVVLATLTWLVLVWTVTAAGESRRAGPAVTPPAGHAPPPAELAAAGR
jgi:cytochrome c oxidase assembly protein subunit 15